MFHVEMASIKCLTLDMDPDGTAWVGETLGIIALEPKLTRECDF